MLTQSGLIRTLGCAEQGQLGRVGERFVARGARRGLNLLVKPDVIHTKNRKIIFKDVWAGSYSTYAKTDNDEIYVCGLNNYGQLGLKGVQSVYTFVKCDSLTAISQESGLKSVTPGQHHSIVLDNKGRVYALGRGEYGRLGLGKEFDKDANDPTVIKEGLEGLNIVEISCGTAVSFAVDSKGKAFSWGMGTNGQLGHEEEDEDSWVPEKVIGKQVANRQVLKISGGGQHTVLLAKDL